MKRLVKQLTFVLDQIAVDLAVHRLTSQPFQRVVTASETRLGKDSNRRFGVWTRFEAEVVQLLETNGWTRSGAKDESVREHGVFGQILTSLELAATGVSRTSESLLFKPLFPLVASRPVSVSRYKDGKLAPVSMKISQRAVVNLLESTELYLKMPYFFQ